MTMRLQLGSRAWERNSPRPFCRRCANYATAVTRHCTVIVLEHAPYMRLYLSRPVRPYPLYFFFVQRPQQQQ